MNGHKEEGKEFEAQQKAKNRKAGEDLLQKVLGELLIVVMTRPA